MRGLLVAFALLSVGLVSAEESKVVLRTTAEVVEAQVRRQWRKFELTARVTCTPGFSGGFVGVEDATGAVIVQRVPIGGAEGCRPGDTVRLTGNVLQDYKQFAVVATKTEVVAHGPPPKPRDATVDDVLRGRCDGRYVWLSGTVRDTFTDELTESCRFLVLGEGDASTFVIFTDEKNEAADLSRFIGAQVSVTGLCGQYSNGERTMLGRTVRISGLDAIEVRVPPPEDPFDAFGRTRVKGRVLARWNGNSVLLRKPDGELCRADLAGEDVPACGAAVEIAGFAETDLYRQNLVRAVWRLADVKTEDEPPPQDVRLRSALEGVFSPMRPIDVKYHGVRIVLSGLVRGEPTAKGVFPLVVEGLSVPVDASGAPEALAGVADGCRVAVTGVCILETDNWRPNGPFPHIRGMTLAVGDPKGIVILSRPSWWTPRRLLAVIAVLLAGLGGVSLWTVLLKRLAERRGQELAAERTAHFETAFRTGERTRLAIELHDAISQNLSGASLQIDAARQAFGADVAKACRCMDVASSTLLACRHELRNCIWDLRNLAWEEKDLNGAIRKTVAALATDVDLQIRFNVPRSRLSDNVTHALLGIIRELVSNAVRHGHAGTVRIAGNLDGERVLCSVRDDGAGFDPAAAPGLAQGHFGLSGIRERLRRLGGTLKVESRPGGGTKVTICL